MYYNPITRRLFLRGIGASLAIPILPSIMGKAYAQSATPKLKYFQIMNAYGVSTEYFHTNNTNLTPQGPEGVYAISLNALGNYSTIIGSSFNPIKNKMSIVRGLHVAPDADNHNTSLGSCASGRDVNAKNSSERTAPVFPYSVDSVIADSRLIYPNSTGIQKHINFCPADIKYKNFSWTKRDGKAQQMPYTSATQGLMAKFGSFGSQTSTASPISLSVNDQNKADVINRVYADYKSLRDNPKLGSEDKRRLEAYMELINEIERGLASEPPPQSNSCSSPQIGSDSSVEDKTKNQIKISLAAMACGLTRVAALTLSTTYDPVHADTHDGKEGSRTESQKEMASYVSYALQLMDSLDDGNGSLLDNSVVYWGNEYGETYGSSPHRTKNMPVVVAGGGAGRLNMGYYIDYGRTGGMPFNNFLISLFNTMGLSSSDYERDGVIGFGEYESSLIKEYGFEKYMSASAKRRSLPFLYKGPQLG